MRKGRGMKKDWTKKLKIIAPVYAAIITTFFGLAVIAQQSLDSTANRADLKVMTLELQKNSPATTRRMGLFRNELRKRADIMLYAVITLMIASAIAAIATIPEPQYSVALLAVSFVMALTAAGFAADAFGFGYRVGFKYLQALI